MPQFKVYQLQNNISNKSNNLKNKTQLVSRQYIIANLVPTKHFSQEKFNLFIQ